MILGTEPVTSTSPTLHFKVGEQFYQALQFYADADHRTIPDLCRMVLADWLNTKEADNDPGRDG